jgi:hypothetical protein
VCAFCGDPFRTRDWRKRYCDPHCQKVAHNFSKRRHEGQETHVTRNRDLAERIVRAYVERGCEVASPQVTGVGGHPFVAAWRNGPLYLIRARLPEEYLREEAA